MKSLAFVLVLSLLPFCVSAQDNQTTIVYIGAEYTFDGTFVENTSAYFGAATRIWGGPASGYPQLYQEGFRRQSSHYLWRW